MEMGWLKTRKDVPVTLCREMDAACRANMAEAERMIPEAQRKFGEACEAVIGWTESDGSAERSKRADQKRYWQDQVYRHQSDRRHWLLRAQAWRQFVQLHPEMLEVAAGAKCSHGYTSPMCVVDQPALKVVPDRMREMGDDE